MTKPRRAVIQPTDHSIRHIALTRNQVAIVDASDYDWLNQWNRTALWHPRTKSFYAVRTAYNPKRRIAMHGLVLGLEAGEQGDHKSRNTLDNRRENLRQCSSQQNSYNKAPRRDNASGFKGVKFHRHTKRWAAAIHTKDTGDIHLGYFDSPQKAAEAYDAAAVKYHGEFAFLNFPKPATVEAGN